jgi:uncharacterized membrane protein YdjX (TVP38/TMEM64 family)
MKGDSGARLKFLLLAFFILLAWFLGGRFPGLGPAIEARLEAGLRAMPLLLSAAFFVLLYVAVTFFIWLAKDIFWIAGAVYFGAFFSACLVFLAEAVNALILFSLARYLGRDYAQKISGRRLGALERKLSGLNFLWLFALRATPLVPYRFMDLAFGLTGLPLKRYIAAVLLGSPLKIFWIQYILAALGKSVFRGPQVMVDYFLRHQQFLWFSLLYVLLVVIVTLKLRLSEICEIWGRFYFFRNGSSLKK